MEDADYINKLRSRISHLDIPKGNIAAIDNFYTFLMAKNAKSRTIVLYLYALEKFLIILDQIDLKKAKREDLEKAIARVNALELSERTKREIRTTVKMFYKYLLGEGLYYPKQVAWIKSTKPRRKLLPESLLTEDEILRMLRVTKNARDKAIIALLYDSGIRIGELQTLKIKDIDLSSELAHITVDGKTGQRKIPIFFSVPYLAQYLSSIKEKGVMSTLWLDARSWNGETTHHAIRIMLKKTAHAAGIEKRMYPHLFRHSRASHYANKLTEQQLKEYFGWTKDSSMLSTYIHLSGRDVDTALSQANGITLPQVETMPKLVVKNCQRCQSKNTMDATYCSKCGSPMDITTALEMQSKEASMKEAIAEALKDPKAIEEIVHTYLLMQAKKGKK